MDVAGNANATGSRFGRPRIISSLRWWIAGPLFASTAINYIDRQTLSVLAPSLKQEYHWTHTHYTNIGIAFRLAYSIVSMLTTLASGFRSFLTFRFLLGAGESGNWPGASKAVSEWFPKHERGLATAFFDSGSSIGGAIAPFIILGAYFRWGWRLAFVIPGILGFIWLIAWRRWYRLPQVHPRI